MKARETQGMLLGLVGVMIFSLTLPMTRIVVLEFHPPPCPPLCCWGSAAKSGPPGRR
jgi:hypothetical protein